MSWRLRSRCPPSQRAAPVSRRPGPNPGPVELRNHKMRCHIQHVSGYCFSGLIRRIVLAVRRERAAVLIGKLVPSASFSPCSPACLGARPSPDGIGLHHTLARSGKQPAKRALVVCPLPPSLLHQSANFCVAQRVVKASRVNGSPITAVNAGAATLQQPTCAANRAYLRVLALGEYC